jgi:hypothetical protein
MDPAAGPDAKNPWSERSPGTVTPAPKQIFRPAQRKNPALTGRGLQERSKPGPAVTPNYFFGARPGTVTVGSAGAAAAGGGVVGAGLAGVLATGGAGRSLLISVMTSSVMS